LAGCGGGGEESRLCHSPDYGKFRDGALVQYRSQEQHDAEAGEPCELILIDNTTE